MGELTDRINATQSRHPKIWGEEVWIANDDDAGYCGKILLLNRGYQCSFHKHQLKTETFFLKNGLVVMQAYGEESLMKPGESLEILPGTMHRFIGITDAEIFEFSSFHMEDDSHRDPTKLSGKVPEDEFNNYLARYSTQIADYNKKLEGSSSPVNCH